MQAGGDEPDRQEQHHEQHHDNVPLHYKKPFGAGLKRTRVEFVRATELQDSAATSTFSSQTEQEKGRLVAEIYASIVLRDGTNSRETEEQSRRDKCLDEQDKASEWTCAVCSASVSASTSQRDHESSLAHQVSLAHSHPPSALDRSRMGLRTLQAQGWDPDARQGLGQHGQGLRFPVRATAKQDGLGVGAAAALAEAAQRRERKSANRIKRGDKSTEATGPNMTAKQRRAEAERQRRKAERLGAEIFGSIDVERYLMGDGSDNRL
ncbi:hypothetical protein CDD82_3660 [Ophiocordyceps australis]|uniref:G-patch domain-containing protein n=1 Tax=Ophiocordyceps australis TaxID=1399860 RepID=A0A2C5ZB62_9HYPO|nr:hypothetical protein CDD82_3660 [Ophiocordyceps australis]